MATNVLIFDVIKTKKFEYKSHYRMYDEDRNLIDEGDYNYVMRKPRKMPAAVLKSKICTGIWQRLVGRRLIKKQDNFRSECLVSNDTIKKELDMDLDSHTTPTKVVENFTKKVETESNPRIFRVVLVNGNYTIVKAENPYLTREQAKEMLFSKQLEEA
jgi:hypothetical protein